MDPISITTTCLSVAKCAYEAVSLVRQKSQQYADVPFNIECLHTELSNANATLNEIVPAVGPRLAFASEDLVIAINRSFSTCQHALERIKEDADKFNAESRRGRLKFVWKEGCEKQRDQLKSQLAGLRALCDIVLMRDRHEQQSAIVRLSSNGHLSNAGLEDDSGDDDPVTPSLGFAPSRNATGNLRRGPSLRFLRPTKGASRALIQAALTGDVTEMERLYDQGADVKYQSQKQPPDNDGMTALHAAAKGGHYRAVEFLIQQGANVNALMVNKFTPLHRAATAQHTEVVRYLIRRGANVNAQNAQGQTPLFKSDGQITWMLLKAQADPNVRDKDVNTPLHHAAYDNHVEAIRLLKEANANVNIRNREGKTALWLVCDRTDQFNLDKSLEIVDILLQRRANPNIACQQGKPPLELCIKENGSKLVDRLIKAGADATFRTRDGITLLHKAATLQSATIMYQLLGRYRCIDTPAQPEQYTPLHAAISKESFACTERLLELGASVNVREHRGMTALHIAAGASMDCFVIILLYYDANLHATDAYNRTPLFYVVQSPAVCECLLDAGASLTATDRVQNSPLHHLVYKANSAVIEILLKRGISVTAVNKAGRTPLEELCADEEGWKGVPNPSRLSSNRLKVFHLLIKYKAVVTPACRASIAGWANVTLRNALTSKLPWRYPSELLAENAFTLGGAGIVLATVGTVFTKMTKK